MSLNLPMSFSRQWLPGGQAPGLGMSAMPMGLSSEVIDAEAFASLSSQWTDLCGRAAVPNVFMDPAVALAFAESWPERLRVLIAWNSTLEESAPQLVGVWLLVERVTRMSWPFRALVGPLCPVTYLGTPVIDRDQGERVLARMLQTIRDTPELPNIIEIGDLSVAPAFGPSLEAALAEVGGSVRQIETRRRARLVRGHDPATFWAQSMSRQRLQGFARKRRQLGKAGRLSFSCVDDPASVAEGLDEFLRLEASGWKGERHSALACDQPTASFTRRMISELAKRRLASVQSLRLDDQPLAMWIVLYSGCAAYTWRTGFDERYARFSPGILLLEETTNDLLARPGIAYTDSCNHRDAGHQAERWPDRHDVRDLLIDLNPRGRLRALILSRREIMIRACRRSLRELYHRLRRGQYGLTARLRATFATRRSP